MTQSQPLKVVGMFAGIGGIELGLHRAGHETLELCEIDDRATAVLGKRFPGIPHHADATQYRELPRGTDLVAAGFPCQDLSQAGRTLGIQGSQSALVGEVFRMLRKQQVPWVLLENVSFMMQLAKGEALSVLVDNLEDLGYKWAYRIVDTRAFGLPQRRERVYILASLDEDPRDVLFADDAGQPEPTANHNGVACGFYWTEGTRGLGWAVNAIPTLKGGSTVGIPSPPAIFLPSGEIVTPGIRDAERLQGFPRDWTKPAQTVGRASFRWKLVGNAVTVDVSKWIGKRLARPGVYSPGIEIPIARHQRWPRAAYNVGDGRLEAQVTSWPFQRKRKDLIDFLTADEVRPLSYKATAGFLSRFEASTLRKPPGFLEALRAHKVRMEPAVATS